MKKHILILALLGLLLNTTAQTALNFKDANANGINISYLDSAYMSAVHVDSTKAAFYDRQEEFGNDYRNMLQAIGDYLDKNNFKWGKPTRCFNRIYFQKDGKIDYFLYSFKDLDQVKEKEFNNLLTQFIKTYKFPLSNKMKFAQCSPVTYMDKDPNEQKIQK